MCHFHYFVKSLYSLIYSFLGFTLFHKIEPVLKFSLKRFLRRRGSDSKISAKQVLKFKFLCAGFYCMFVYSLRRVPSHHCVVEAPLALQACFLFLLP